MLAALLFLAILIPVVVEALTLSNRTSVISERSSLASELAENKMSELTLNNEWSTGETQGDFGEDWPDYRWELTQADWEPDTMTELTLNVYYPVQGTERSVSLATLVSLSGTTSTSGSGSSGSFNLPGH